MPKGIKGFQKGHPSYVDGKIIKQRWKEGRFKNRKIDYKKLGIKVSNTLKNKYKQGVLKPNKGTFKKGQTSGEKSNFWKGGITPINNKIRTSSKYKEWRKKVFERDDYICKECNQSGYIEAHHVKSFKDYPELRFDLNNGITLCPKCHSKIDTQRRIKGGYIY